MNDGKHVDDIGLEWEERVLCSDEGCIGVIGPDGRCKECGRRFEGVLPQDQAPAEPQGTAEADPEQGAGLDESKEPVDLYGPAGNESMDDEWERRTLCADESCIGVIGDDGRCNECGKPYPPKD